MKLIEKNKSSDREIKLKPKEPDPLLNENDWKLLNELRKRWLESTTRALEKDVPAELRKLKDPNDYFNWDKIDRVFSGSGTLEDVRAVVKWPPGRFIDYWDKKALIKKINDSLKELIKTNDLDKLLDFISWLGVDASRNPVISRIESILKEKYHKATIRGEKDTKKCIEKFVRKLGRVLFLGPKFTKRIQVRRLLDALGDKYPTISSRLDHIKKVYEKERKKLEGVRGKGIRGKRVRGERIRGTEVFNRQAALEKYKEMLREAEKKGDKNEMRTYRQKISKLEKEEDKTYKEARRRTILELQKETGTKINMRELGALISLFEKPSLEFETLKELGYYYDEELRAIVPKLTPEQLVFLEDFLDAESI